MVIITSINNTIYNINVNNYLIMLFVTIHTHMVTNNITKYIPYV